MSDKRLADLNPEQRRAVTHGEGPLLIVAGAGTGKTTVITRRIAYLIAEKKALPREILALTFTDKSANEMEARVDVLVPYGYVDTWISTFHAFGDRILKEFAVEAELDPAYRLLTREEQYVFLKERLFELPASRHFIPLGNPTKFLDALITHFSRAKDEDIGPDEYAKYAKKLKGDEGAKMRDVAVLYAAYEKLKDAAGFIDYGDQIRLMRRLLDKSPKIREELQNRFKYVLVDEFQDTNTSQFELVKSLAGKKKNLTVVGDDDQSIYRFRGAAISNILMFQKTFPRAQTVVITNNYRSTQPILDTAYKLIQYNNPDRLEVKTGISKKLIGRDGGTPPVFRWFESVASEADAVAKIIEEHIDSSGGELSRRLGQAGGTGTPARPAPHRSPPGRSYKDFAILVRANRDAAPFMDALRRRGIPFRFSGAPGFYDIPEVHLVLNFIRAIARPDDSPSLYYLAASEIYSVDPVALQLAAARADRRHRPLFEILQQFRNLEEAQSASKEALASIDRFLEEFKHWVARATRDEAHRVIFDFLNDGGGVGKGPVPRLTRKENVDLESIFKALNRLFERIKSFEHISPHKGVRELADYVNGLRESREDPLEEESSRDRDEVHILTIHKAKGLEFPVVFMVALADGKFPSQSRPDQIPLPDKFISEILPSGDAHIQEERRLFYVGMTRAQTELYLFSSQNYGGKRDRKVSPFILEALDLPKAMPAAEPQKAAETLQLFGPEPTPTPAAPAVLTGPLRLYFSAIEAYEQCPRKYQYRYVFRIPELPSHGRLVGSALHKVAEVLNTAKKKGRTLPSLPELTKVLEKAWENEGFIHRAHEDRRFQASRAAVKRLLAYEKKNKYKPFLIEEPFEIKVGDVTLSGRFDRVDQRNGRGVIIDYKSTEVDEQEVADKKARDSHQLTLYAMAYRERFGELPESTQLHFLDTGLIGSVQKTEKDIAKGEKLISRVAEGIRSQNFAPTPNTFKCGMCDYRAMCPSREG